MYITENQNLLESLNFLVCARLTLIEMAKDSSLKKEDKTRLINYIQNEATDYEIMHAIVREEFPDEPENHGDELRLFSDLKEQVIAAYSYLLEYFNPVALNSFIYEVDSVYPNYSSAKPILEQQISEVRPGPAGWKAAKFAAAGKTPAETGKEAVKTAVDFWTKQWNKFRGSAEEAAAKETLKTAANFWKKAGGDVRNMIAKGIAREKLITSITEKGFSRAEAIKIIESQKALLKKVGDASKYLDGSFMGKYFAGLGKAAIAVGKKMEPVGQAVGKAAGSAGSALAKAGHKVGAGAIVDKIRMAATSAGPALQKALSDPTLVGAGIAASALAALALYTSNKFYKRFMTKAAKSCKGQSGKAKTQCMKQYQIKGYQAQVADLNKAAAACSKAKEPEKCKAPLLKKISKLQKKIQKVG